MLHHAVPRPTTVPPEACDLIGVRQAVNDALDRFIDAKEHGSYGACLSDPLRVLRDFLGAGANACALYICAPAGTP